MLIELEGLEAEAVHALQASRETPPGVVLTPMAVDAVLDGEREGFQLTASLILASEVSTDDAVRWLWPLLIDEEAAAVVICTVAGERRELRRPDDLAKLVEEGRAAE